MRCRDLGFEIIGGKCERDQGGEMVVTVITRDADYVQPRSAQEVGFKWIMCRCAYLCDAPFPPALKMIALRAEANPGVSILDHSM